MGFFEERIPMKSGQWTKTITAITTFFLLISLDSIPVFAQTAENKPQLMAETAVVSGSTDTVKKCKAASYFDDTFGIGTWIGAGILAGRDQGRNSGSASRPHGEPPEWGQGAEGYGTRYGSRFGQIVISQTVRYGLGSALHEDVTFHPCECSGFFPRISHVVVGSYTARTSSGRTVFSIPNTVGPLAAGQIAVAGWYPSRFDQGQGLRLAIPLLTGGLIRNTIKEFLKK